MEQQKKAYAFALTSIFFWSTVATAIKIALRHFHPAQMLLVAIATSVVVLSVILMVQGKFRELFTYSPRQYLLSAALGFLNPFLYYTVLLKAYDVLPAQIAQPLNYAWPVMLVLLSVPLLGQKLKPISLLAILISFSGVFFISSEGQWFAFNPTDPLGVALALGSSIVWALFWIYNVRDTRDEVQKLLLNFFFGGLFTLVSLWWWSDFDLAKPAGLAASVYLGVFEIGITFVLWLKAMHLTRSNDKIGNLVFLAPFVSLVFIHFILGESIYLTTIVGLGLIVTGIFIQQYGNRTRKHTS